MREMKLDLANQNLQKIDSDVLQERIAENDKYDEKNVETVLLDNNFLSKLDNLDRFSNIKHVINLQNRDIYSKLYRKLTCCIIYRSYR